MAKKMRKILRKAYLLIGLIIFIFIVKDIDFNQFKEVALTINFFYYISAAIIYLPIVFLKSYRWKKIMDIQKIHYSIKNAFLMYGSSSLLGLVTPGKIGDFSRMAYLKKDKHSLGRAFLGNFLDRLSDLFFISVFSIIAFFFLPLLPHLSLDYYTLIKWGGLAAALLSVLIIFFYLAKKESFYNFISEIVRDLKQFRINNILFILLISAINWLFYFFLIYLIAASINLHQTIGFLYLSFTAGIGILAAFVPISVLGIGTREATFIFLLTPLGIPKETIILFSLLVLVNYLTLFLIYLYCWFKKPVI